MPQARKDQTHSGDGYPDENSVRINKLPINLEMAARLRQARIAAGYPRPIDAAKAFGWTLATYWAHENGSRGFPTARQLEYATSFRVSRDWLAFGRGEMRERRRRLPIEGYVTQLGKILTPEEVGRTGSEAEYVEMPPGTTEEYRAFKIMGNYPFYRDGDVLYVGLGPHPLEMAIGKECVVRTKTGEHLIRTVMHGSRAGVFMLTGHNVPTIADIELDEAAPIRWIDRGG